MHLNCPECRAPISYDDVNLVQTIAKCKFCNNIFDFKNKIGSSEELPGRYRKEIVIPPGIEVLHLMSELEIMINWRRSAKTFTIFFALFWNAFITIFFTIAFLQGEPVMFLFSIPFFLVGIYLIYASLGYVLNTSYITVDENRLSLVHKPINFLIQKDRHYSPNEIKQLFVRKYSVGKTNDKPVYAFAVDLILKSGKQQTLVKALHSVDYARYIEQEIEYYLKIKDRPVDGEFDQGL
ncbi:MAG: hypothetical protein ACI8VT_003234 [Saprospiraceae bacterium]|jgi:hypothetical protein